MFLIGCIVIKINSNEPYLILFINYLIIYKGFVIDMKQK